MGLKKYLIAYSQAPADKREAIINFVESTLIILIGTRSFFMNVRLTKDLIRALLPNWPIALSVSFHDFLYGHSRLIRVIIYFQPERPRETQFQKR